MAANGKQSMELRTINLPVLNGGAERSYVNVPWIPWARWLRGFGGLFGNFNYHDEGDRKC